MTGNVATCYLRVVPISFNATLIPLSFYSCVPSRILVSAKSSIMFLITSSKSSTFSDLFSLPKRSDFVGFYEASSSFE